MLRIIPSIMLNCRPPNMAGQGAPDGERSRGPTRAGKRSAVRGRGGLSDRRACQWLRASGNEGKTTSNGATEPVAQHPAALESDRRSPLGAASPWPRRLGRRAPGGVRAETEGEASNEAAEGIAEVAKAAVWP